MNRAFTRLKVTALFLALVAVGFSSCRRDVMEKIAPAGGSTQKLTNVSASIKQYYLYLPKDYYTSNKSYPVIVFLHGGTQIGASDAAVLAQVGVPQYAVAHNADFPYIVIAPLLTNEVEAWNIGDLERMMNEITSLYRIDQTRQSVTGFSLGGTATWLWASSYPGRFSAMSPIACSADQNVCNVKNIALWAFHNRYDQIYTLPPMEQAIKELKACGGNAKLTIYDDGGHEGWTKAYNDASLYAWFQAQQRK